MQKLFYQSLILTINKYKQNNIKSIKIDKPNLESIFLELTGKRLSEDEDKSSKQHV